MPSDRFIYNKANGALLFDADGIGTSGSLQFAQLSANLALTINLAIIEIAFSNQRKQ